MSELKIGLTVDVPELERQVKRIADRLSTPEWSFENGSLTLGNLKTLGITKNLKGEIMFRVPANHANVPFTITLPKVVNSEGGVVPGWTVTSEIVSDNAASVAVLTDPALLTGEIEIVAANVDGSPSQATVTTTFTATHPTDTDSPRVNQIAEVFVVEAGDEVGFAGGGITFTGLTPEPTV